MKENLFQNKRKKLKEQNKEKRENLFYVFQKCFSFFTLLNFYRKSNKFSLKYNFNNKKSAITTNNYNKHENKTFLNNKKFQNNKNKVM